MNLICWPRFNMHRWRFHGVWMDRRICLHCLRREHFDPIHGWIGTPQRHQLPG